MGEPEAVLKRLMIAAQGGDRPSYHQLLVAVQHWLRRYYSGRIAPDAVDDLVQEVLLALHRKRASYDPAQPFMPWLAAIARYRWIDRLRRHYRAAEVELGDHDPELAGHEDVVGAQISIDRMLGLLPPGQAAALRCVKIEGLSIAEAGAKTGQSEALVKVNVHRAIKRLAAAVEQA